VGLAKVPDPEAVVGQPGVDQRIGDRLAQFVAEVIGDVVGLVSARPSFMRLTR
jgi:hypothetical protein